MAEYPGEVKICNLIIYFLGKNYFVFIMFIILFSVISSLRLLLEDFLAATWLFLHWIKHFEWCINCESGTSKWTRYQHLTNAIFLDIVWFIERVGFTVIGNKCVWNRSTPTCLVVFHGFRHGTYNRTVCKLVSLVLVQNIRYWKGQSIYAFIILWINIVSLTILYIVTSWEIIWEQNMDNTHTVFPCCYSLLNWSWKEGFCSCNQNSKSTAPK